MRVFLDDIRKPYKGYIVYRTAEELIKGIEEGRLPYIEVLSLDHDLGVNDKGELVMDGSKFVKELVYLIMDGKVSVGRVRFHTSNYTGYEYMKTTLESAVKRGFIKVSVEDRLTDYLEELKEG